MTSPASIIPISSDYTSRDYYALREELIARIQNRIPEWKGNDPADFGVALVEAFAYMADNLNYYIDRVANENFIYTATQRQSILELAANLGYVPTGYRAASVLINLANDTLDDVTLPIGTQFLIDVVCEDEIKQLYFTTTEEVVALASSTTLVNTTNGEWVSTREENLAVSPDVSAELLGESSGTPNQIFGLSENQVVEGSVSIYVENGDIFEEWTQVSHITDSGPNDAVYTLAMDADNFVYAIFGDGVSGAIPTIGAAIKADYMVGGGILGNIPSGYVDGVHFIPGVSSEDLAAISGALTITNEEGLGGAEPESNDNIRYAAPLFFTAQNRAVTLKDFANLALGVSQVGKANAIAESRESVVIFIGPDPDPTSTWQYPGYDTGYDPAGTNSPSETSWIPLKEAVLESLADKVMIGTTVTVAPPVYVTLNIQVQYTRLAQFTDAQVEAGIKQAIINQYSYGNSGFASVMYPEDVEYYLRQVSGVKSLQVKVLSKTTTGRDVIIGADNEIFVFNEADIEIISAAALDDIIVKDGVTVLPLSPGFNTSLTNYSITLGTGVENVSVTPSSFALTAVITVDGTPVASGTASALIITPVGLTNIDVVVTGEDGATTRTYKITINRPSA